MIIYSLIKIYLIFYDLKGEYEIILFFNVLKKIKYLFIYY